MRLDDSTYEFIKEEVIDLFTRYGDTIAIFLPNHRNSESGRAFAEEGIAEARRKGWIKGPIEVWFSNKTKIEY